MYIVYYTVYYTVYKCIAVTNIKVYINFLKMILSYS